MALVLKDSVSDGAMVGDDVVGDRVVGDRVSCVVGDQLELPHVTERL